VTDLRRELEEAEARAAALRRKIAAASCHEVGHRWKFIGGRNCCCEAVEVGEHGGCSVPVHECAVCGDCDYGDNEEADDIRAACAREAAA
jgi:hypothetical protein